MRSRMFRFVVITAIASNGCRSIISYPLLMCGYDFWDNGRLLGIDAVFEKGEHLCYVDYGLGPKNPTEIRVKCLLVGVSGREFHVAPEALDWVVVRFAVAHAASLVGIIANLQFTAIYILALCINCIFLSYY
jgi:hypothetical protein